MLEKGKISPRQAGELMFITLLATVILLVPEITADLAGHDAWLATFVGSLFGLLTVGIIAWLGLKHPGKTIYQYAESVLGKYPGKLVGLAYVWIFLHLAAMVVRQFGDFLTTSFMVLTPLSVFNISLTALAALAVIMGLEVITRMSEFIILLVVSFLLLVITLSIGNWELNQLLPFMKDGIMPVLRGAIVPAAFHGEIVVLAVLIPFLTRPKAAFLSGTAAVTASALLLTMAVVGTLAVFGPELTTSFRFPIHLFVRSINIGKVLTRFEVVVMVTWVAGVFIKISVLYYCAALGTAQVFGLSEYRSTVLPLGVLITALSVLLFEDIAELVSFLAQAWPRFSISVYFFGLPFLLLLVTVIREKIFGHSFGGQQDE
ncbi:MAG: endospore germination permease [Clostridiales bacterium]|jgi:spore germination protein KB|nr:endospore germination permease [Clostridiales bacterium]